MEEQDTQNILVEPEKPKSKTKYIVGVFVLFMVVLFAGAAYASPGLVWKKFIEKNISSSVVSSNFNFAYTDNYNSTVEAEEFSLMPKGLKLSMNGSSYSDTSDLNNIQSSMDADYAMGSGDTSFNSRISFILNGENIYLYFGSNPLTSLFITDQNQGWIKFNLTDLKKNAGTAGELNLDNWSQNQKAYQDLAVRYYPKMLVVKKVKGLEKLEEGYAAHFENTLEKNHAKAYLKEVFGLVLSQIQAQSLGDELNPAEIAEAKKGMEVVVDSFVDRLEVKSFETWVYVSRQNLAKIKLETNAPSIGSLFSMDNIETGDSDSSKNTQEIMAKISFDAKFSFEQEYKKYGEKQVLNIPTNALDYSEFLRQQEQQQSLYEEDFSNWDQTYEGE